MLTGNSPPQANTHSALRPCNKENAMEVLLDVVRVDPRPDYTLILEFENGERRLFDMAPYLEKKPFPMSWMY